MPQPHVLVAAASQQHDGEEADDAEDVFATLRSTHTQHHAARTKASLLEITSPLSSADQLPPSPLLSSSPYKHAGGGGGAAPHLRARGHSIGSSNRTTLYHVDALDEQPHAAWLRDAAAAAQAAKAAGGKKRWSTWTATTVLSSGGEADGPFDEEDAERRGAAGALFSSDEYTDDVGGTSGTSDSVAGEAGRSPLHLGHASADEDDEEDAATDAALDAAIAASQRALDMANALLHSTLSARATFTRLHAAESALEASLDVREERLRAQLARSNEACALVSRASLDLRSLAVPASSAAPARPAHWRMPSSGASAKPMATVVDVAEGGESTPKAWLEASDKDATIGKTAARRLERVLSASHAAAASAAAAAAATEAEAAAAAQEAEDEVGSVADSRRTSVTAPSSTHSRAPSISVSNADSTHSRTTSLSARDALAALTSRTRSTSGASAAAPGIVTPSRTAPMQRVATAPPLTTSGFTFPASVSASSSAARKQRSTLRIASLTGSGFEPAPTSSASLSVDYNSPERSPSPSDLDERHAGASGSRSPAFPFSNWSMRERSERPGSRASLASLGSLASIDERDRSGGSSAGGAMYAGPPMLSPSLSTASSSLVSPTSAAAMGWTSASALRSVSGSSAKTISASASASTMSASPSAALLAAKLRASTATRSPRLARTRAGHSSSGSVSADAQGLLTSPALGHDGEGAFESGESDDADESDASLVRVRRRRRSKALGALEALRKVQAGEEEPGTPAAAAKEQTGYGWGGLASWVRGGNATEETPAPAPTAE